MGFVPISQTASTGRHSKRAVFSFRESTRSPSSRSLIGISSGSPKTSSRLNLACPPKPWRRRESEERFNLFPFWPRRLRRRAKILVSPVTQCPATESGWLGLVVPTPTRPCESITKAVLVAVRGEVETANSGYAPLESPPVESLAKGDVVRAGGVTVTRLIPEEGVVIAARLRQFTRLIAHIDAALVVVVGRAFSRFISNRDRACGGGVVVEGVHPHSRVVNAGGVGEEGAFSHGRVGSAGGVGVESAHTHGRVVGAGGVGVESAHTHGRVGSASGVGVEGVHPHGRVGSAGGVEKEGGITHCRVAIARIIRRATGRH